MMKRAVLFPALCLPITCKGEEGSHTRPLPLPPCEPPSPSAAHGEKGKRGKGRETLVKSPGFLCVRGQGFAGTLIPITSPPRRLKTALLLDFSAALCYTHVRLIRDVFSSAETASRLFFQSKRGAVFFMLFSVRRGGVNPPPPSLLPLPA